VAFQGGFEVKISGMDHSIGFISSIFGEFPTSLMGCGEIVFPIARSGFVQRESNQQRKAFLAKVGLFFGRCRLLS
jgi:hypothetical protein